MSRKNDPDFTKMVEEHIQLDAKTGQIKLNGLYANLCLNIGWKGQLVVVPYSHIVWLLTRKRWPKNGLHVDHINDNPLDNRPENLQELTEENSHKKRRGRIVYRSYGTGKYGYGMYIHHDKRDDRFYVTRHLSRGHGDGDLRTIRKSLGGFDTLAEAETKVAECIEEIKKYGLDHVPAAAAKKDKRMTKLLDTVTPRLRDLRLKGHTIQEIADLTGMASGSIYKRIRDIDVDCRITPKAVTPKRVPLRLNK